MRKFIFLLTALVALSFGTCRAEVKTFHAESSYVMDRGESIKDAQDTEFKEAVKMMSEEACVIVKSSGAMKDNELTAEEIETITAAVLRIKSKTFGKKFTNEGSLEISAVVEAEVDTANIDKLFSELSAAHNPRRLQTSA